MPKSSKVSVKEKVEDNVCDLSLCELKEIPVKEIVSMGTMELASWAKVQSKRKKKCEKTRMKSKKRKPCCNESESYCMEDLNSKSF